MNTRRQQIIGQLSLGPHTIRGLAIEFRTTMAQIADDLAHVQRSLGGRFVVEPAECEACGLVFEHRKRLTAPSRCPQCKSERTSAPRFMIDGGSQ